VSLPVLLALRYDGGSGRQCGLVTA